MKKTEKQMMPQFSESKAITGIEKFHSLSENQVVSKHYYFSQNKFVHNVTTLDLISPTDLEQLNSGFVTVAYDGSWWLGCILQKNNNEEYKVSFLHPWGPAASFYYPQPEDILDVPGHTLLQKVEPLTPTGRVYTLSKEEIKVSSLTLVKYGHLKMTS